MIKKHTILSLILCFAMLFGAIGLAGCGDSSIDSLSKNITAMEDAYTANNTVFLSNVYVDSKGSGNISNSVKRNYVVSYGDTLDNGYIYDSKEYQGANFLSVRQNSGFVELWSKYNTMLIISCDYIDSNTTYVVTNLKTLEQEKKLTNEIKNAIKTLNKDLEDYTAEISEFVEARASFVSHFETFGSSASDEQNEIYLRRFKKSYGELVSKNITVSLDFANMIEVMGVFDTMQKADPTADDTTTIKNYFEAKMLPIFSEFMLTELENKFNWSATTETDAKTTIDNILSTLSTRFETYKTEFWDNSTTKTLTLDEMKEILDMFNSFSTEQSAYITALKGLDISSLAIDYDNDLTKYKEKNALAETYIEKLDQFVGTTLDKFLTYATEILNSTDA